VRLARPTISAARALFGGAEHIERVDALVARIARQHGLRSRALEEIVGLVDARLARNRAGRREGAPAPVVAALAAGAA
jgi:ParB-like chromosome segregation protein Spo0J